jgi:hypothetical protein
VVSTNMTATFENAICWKLSYPATDRASLFSLLLVCSSLVVLKRSLPLRILLSQLISSNLVIDTLLFSRHHCSLSSNSASFHHHHHRSLSLSLSSLLRCCHPLRA